MPIADIGGGLFRARYGSYAASASGGTPVFWHPVRVWDRYAKFADDAELSYFQFRTELDGAFIKRFFWKEGTVPQFLNVRVNLRFDEGARWNEREEDIIWLSQDFRRGYARTRTDSASTGPRRTSHGRDVARVDKHKFLYAAENPGADNLLYFGANNVEGRLYMVYEPGAFQWANPTITGWKFSTVVQGLYIEYMQQNRVRRNIDR